MALILLLPLLASLQILPRPVSPSDPPPAPTLSWNPWYTVYLPGERVNLTCSAPGREEVSGYRFFYQKGQQDPSIVLNPNAGARLEFTAEKGNAGTYTCAYWRLESHQEISSRKSSSVSITVTDPPPPPTLSLHPLHPIYIPGESVMLRCSAPFGEEVKRYRFFSQRQEQLSKGDSSQDTWLITTTYTEDSEVYSCVYWIMVLGRQIPSQRSPPFTVPVMDPLPRPVLSVDPPSAVVSEGLPLLITCVAPRNSGEQRFHFYKDEVEIIPREAGSEINTTEPGTGSLNISVLSIPRASLNNIGEFTCGYEENMSKRWIPSPRSWAVNITVTVTRTNILPQPVLSVHPPSGAVSEGLPMLITCMAPRNAGERTFHFYNDGAKIFPEDVGSEVNTTESRICSMNISVFSILWSGSNNTGEFTCEYEENVSGKWILSPRSWAVNITLSARSFLCIQELVLGGSFFLINGFIFLVSHCYF